MSITLLQVKIKKRKQKKIKFYFIILENKIYSSLTNVPFLYN